MDVTLADAARRLGVTRRHLNDLLTSGEIDGRKLSSGAWMINTDAIARFERLRKGAGRRMAPETAWAVLFELSGIRATWLPARTYARVRERIRDDTGEDIAAAVAYRAKSHAFHADGAELDDIVPTGVSALEVLDTGLIGSFTSVMGYLPAGFTFQEYADKHLLFADPAGPDVLLENTSPVPLAGPQPAVVAADLALSGDARERQAGIDALENLRAKWLAANSK